MTYQDEHTLREPTDLGEVDNPSAYIEEADGRVRLDPSSAVLISDIRSCLVQSPEGELGIAFQLSGPIGAEGKEVNVTHIGSLASMAQMVGHIIELAISANEESATMFKEYMQQEMQRQVHNHGLQDEGDDLERP